MFWPTALLLAAESHNQPLTQSGYRNGFSSLI